MKKFLIGCGKWFADRWVVSAKRNTMKMKSPHILLINPYIHDFAAYDFWARPHGLLELGAILRFHGMTVSYIDCLDRFHPEASFSDPSIRNGRGSYMKTTIRKPAGFKDIPRTYSRYGIKPEWFIHDLKSIPKPDLILMTSLMTYWYPGVQETIERVRSVYKGVPIILGGIYATLCREHAIRCSGADEVISGPCETRIIEIVGDITNFSITPRYDMNDPDSYPYPAYDLQRKIPYVPILTSKGCPFSCAYCAAHLLNPHSYRRNPIAVADETRYWYHTHHVRNFAFYDDALLVDAKNHAIPLFEEIIRSGMNCSFHTPNAVHIRGIDKQVAELLFRSGFQTVRLGLETTIFENRDHLDHKVNAEEFSRSVSLLKEAGFSKHQIGAYLLVGMPDQTLEAIEHSIHTVKSSGITPIPAYYSPIPHTELWRRAVETSRYDLENDPIFTNNAVLPCGLNAFSWNIITRIKSLCQSN